MTSFFAARSACTPLAADPSCSRLSTAACCRAARTAASRSAAASSRTAAMASSTAAYTSSETDDADDAGPRTRPRHQPGDGRRHDGGEEHGQDDHEGHDARGVSQRARMGYNPGWW